MLQHRDAGFAWAGILWKFGANDVNRIQPISTLARIFIKKGPPNGGPHCSISR